MLIAESRKVMNQPSVKNPIYSLVLKWLHDGQKVTLAKPKTGNKARVGQYVVMGIDQSERINFDRSKKYD